MSMKILVSIGTAILALLAGAPPAQQVPSKDEVLSLCSALEKAGPGEKVPVLLSGAVLIGSEQQVFFDADQPRCSWDVQPSTWVEIEPGAPGSGHLERILKASGLAVVTVRGELYGPPPLGPDDPSLNPVAAYANRVAGRRYGHLGWFRTKLAVRDVLEAAPAPAGLASRLIRDRPASHRLQVTAAQVPQYPEMARRAGISGEVVLRCVVKAGKVASTSLLSGDRLLGMKAAANVGTWRFPADTSETLTTTYIYRLERRPSGSSTSPEVELDLPWLARITAPENGW